MNAVRTSVLSVLMLGCLVSSGVAQETTGTILGALVDQTGAVLPGVKLVITNVDTGQVRELATSKEGQYSASLPGGRYEISFLLPNFQPFTARGLSLHVNDRLQVNGRLVIGLVETLTVTAERLVQPSSAVKYLIEPTAVKELPLLTRTLVQLATLVPGVSSDLREDACFCDQGNLNISINGARRSAVNWLLDGASNVNGFNNYTLVTTPSLEAIQEITVLTSTYSAEWAGKGGGVVNAVTKSGMSRFSGSAYHFLRNDGLNANSFFRNRDSRPEVNSAPPRLRYNNFGYTVGGPALPGRKKLFFFASEEWRRSTRATGPVGGTVPDPAWLTDPASPQYVPPEARDPNAVKLLALWPAPNVPGTARYQTTLTNAFDTRQEFVRTDYHVGARWALTGRYLHDRVDSRGERAVAPDWSPSHRYTVGGLSVVEGRRSGARLLYDASYQLSRHRASRDDPAHTRAETGAEIGELFFENAADLVPNVSIDGVIPLLGSQSDAREYLNHTFSSAMTVPYRTHALKLGGRFAVEDVNSNLFPESTHGSFGFRAGGGFSAFQNFLRGNTSGACGESCNYVETDTDVLNRFRSNRYELYFQDTWRMHPRVTVDLGVRYSYYPPLQDQGDRLFTFVPDEYRPAAAPAFADPDGWFLRVGTGDLFNGIRVAGRNSPYGRALHAADTNNLQPRIGAAWDPTGAGRMIVRAGYGVYFDQTQVGMVAQNVQESSYDPFRSEVFVSNPSLSNPGGGTVIEPYGVATPYALAIGDPLVAPRWQHWNVGLQRRLYARGVIDVGYVGSRGDHLLRYVDINQPQLQDFADHAEQPNTVRPFLGYSEIVMRETTARSRHHGFVASFRHDADRAGFATVNYTFGRTNADATFDNAELDDPQNPLDKDAEFGETTTDRSHIFNAAYVYELPFARGATGGWRNAVLGGWQVAGITRIESGPAARVQVGNCNYDGECFPAALRPNQVAMAAAGEQSGLLWFNPAAFAPSPAGEYGSAPVAPFRLPGRHQWDIALSKNVGLGGTTRLQIRADLINAFNQTQFLDVNTQCSGSTTCGPTSGPAPFGQVTSTRPPREIQLGVRLHW